MLDVRNLSFAYSDCERNALTHLSFQVNEGDFVLVCGASGCGKTTLLRHLKPALKPYGRTEGQVFYRGTELESLDKRKQVSEIGYVFQDPNNQLVTDKVWHELAFGLESLGMDTQTIRLRVAEMASYFGIEKWFYEDVSHLSGGQKQMLNLASVMAMHPGLLLLDEPTSQLDPIAAGEFLTTVKKINREFGITIIMTEHRLQEVFPLADRVLLLEGGEILSYETPAETGAILKGQEHPMFRSLPAPMQVFEAMDGEGRCPMDVGEGRKWLARFLDSSTTLKNPLEDISEAAPEGEVVLEMEEVWFRYERQSQDILKGMSLSVTKGQIFCLLGGNGTGKTTALSLLSGLKRPQRGKIQIQGTPLKAYGPGELYRGLLGVVPQNPQTLFRKSTVRAEVEEQTGGMEMAKLLHLEGLLDHHPYDLSGGEQQRLALAKVLQRKPKILLLDEPTKGLDGPFKEELAKIFLQLKRKGTTIFMISHDIEFCAEYGDTCGLFFDGDVLSVKEAGSFFAGNSFYTTASNRMAGSYFHQAVKVKDVIACCKANL